MISKLLFSPNICWKYESLFTNLFSLQKPGKAYFSPVYAPRMELKELPKMKVGIDIKFFKNSLRYFADLGTIFKSTLIWAGGGQFYSPSWFSLNN